MIGITVTGRKIANKASINSLVGNGGFANKISPTEGPGRLYEHGFPAGKDSACIARVRGQDLNQQLGTETDENR
ncbi:hypothetical protein [Herbaspirillum lusitanum]|uniref:hypothetical protein n=1 Tax=Herbaspirillum lusitanum TaxID=213312 RepID=UPI0012F4BA19|nr:hypothetical protein [Herbaspirillum lusitanum]